ALKVRVLPASTEKDIVAAFGTISGESILALAVAIGIVEVADLAARARPPGGASVRGRQSRQLIVFATRETIFNVAIFGQPAAERSYLKRRIIGRSRWRKPTTGAGCCARAANGQAAAVPPRRVMNSPAYGPLKTHLSA
ncbi:MAG: hypothetical protein WAL14_08940, partial [Pseudolabrys sp.]